MAKAKKKTAKTKTKTKKKTELSCGLVMPISAMGDLTAEHWSEVKDIVIDSIESIEVYDFSVALVSDAIDVGVIQKRIVHNLYDSDIVVCDVSAKNPNVMFELGMRLAFDKPTIIIKDDKTDYSFDTSIIEHIPYPRDLHYGQISSFKEALAQKVTNTYLAAKGDANHSTFLKSFGKFQAATLPSSGAGPDAAVLEMLSDIQGQLSRIRLNNENTGASPQRILRTQEGARRLHSIMRTFSKADLLKYSKDLGFYSYLERKIRRYFSSVHEAREAVVMGFTSRGISLPSKMIAWASEPGLLMSTRSAL